MLAKVAMLLALLLGVGAGTALPHVVRDIHHRLSKVQASSSIRQAPNPHVPLPLPDMNAHVEAMRALRQRFSDGSISLDELWDEIAAKNLPLLPDIVNEHRDLKEQIVQVCTRTARFSCVRLLSCFTVGPRDCTMLEFDRDGPLLCPRRFYVVAAGHLGVRRPQPPVRVLEEDSC